MTNSEKREELVDSIGLLSIPGIGRGRFHHLVRSFGSPAAVLAAPVSKLETVPGISRSLASNIKSLYDGAAAKAVAARIIQLGWTVLTPKHKEFPALLRNIPSVPPLLFRLGHPAEPDEKMIAIVGTRIPSEPGRMFAFKLAAALARAGITVVSGMAEGIDSVAHSGALENACRTVAIWGSSLDVVYPPSNKSLAERIKTHGAVYSEYFPDTRPDRAFFPERNRIIAGMSYGVVVVEAGEKSGALITARHALEQGRELFAVPGLPEAKISAGTNRLIKEGARLLTSVDDIFEELPLLKGQILSRKYAQLPDMTNTEREIVKLFSDGPKQVDQISRSAHLPISEILEYLLALELKGVVRELSGKRFVLSEEYVC